MKNGKLIFILAIVIVGLLLLAGGQQSEPSRAAPAPTSTSTAGLCRVGGECTTNASFCFDNQNIDAARAYVCEVKNRQGTYRAASSEETTAFRNVVKGSR